MSTQFAYSLPTVLWHNQDMADGSSKRIARARTQYDRAYAQLVEAIREEIAAGAVGVSEAARQAKWSREYVGQVRSGASGDTPPKHRRPSAA